MLWDREYSLYIYMLIMLNFNLFYELCMPKTLKYMYSISGCSSRTVLNDYFVINLANRRVLSFYLLNGR